MSPYLKTYLMGAVIAAHIVAVGFAKGWPQLERTDGTFDTFGIVLVVGWPVVMLGAIVALWYSVIVWVVRKVEAYRWNRR